MTKIIQRTNYAKVKDDEVKMNIVELELLVYKILTVMDIEGRNFEY